MSTSKLIIKDKEEFLDKLSDFVSMLGNNKDLIILTDKIDKFIDDVDRGKRKPTKNFGIEIRNLLKKKLDDDRFNDILEKFVKIINELFQLKDEDEPIKKKTVKKKTVKKKTVKKKTVKIPIVEEENKEILVDTFMDDFSDLQIMLFSFLRISRSTYSIINNLQQEYFKGRNPKTEDKKILLNALRTHAT